MSNKRSPAKRTNRPSQQRTSVQVSRTELHVGPIPDPETLAKYDAIVPGSARMIIDEFQLQATHRRRLESETVSAGITAQHLGQWLAFTLFGMVTAGAIVLGLNDQPAVAVALVGMEFAAGVGVYGYGKRDQRRQLESRS